MKLYVLIYSKNFREVKKLLYMVHYLWERFILCLHFDLAVHNIRAR